MSLGKTQKAPAIRTGKYDWILGIWDIFHEDTALWLDMGKPSCIRGTRYTPLAKYEYEVTLVFPEHPRILTNFFPVLRNHAMYVAGLSLTWGYVGDSGNNPIRGI